ncbi:hypothetical protein MOO45_08085 (plasmid) [Bombilactobacillus folatiphilus]|uniref:Bacterial Pleckstrin homology domain-containing protein n=1 Tax=Bombilactobacillus folatiphilus TaxID=2923362 RepID=A0ABY4PAV0_9LACO|nr:hypothetical protein [Bombilactobacillus folatiphilus]UQS81433.1 hypothetical protein MOO45_04180 [Bombilactobacillus folatiphilus]UQS82834.1 hypothetical protein MOO45_04115 [Bombilactobacillus folatiphilus]UQS82940.1 hypothetical protein MOO45_08085 [Bombilactobacillus folatiphilus]
MLSFGRKPLYRPLMVSFVISAVCGLFVGSVFRYDLGFLTFIICFILAILNYASKIDILDGFLKIKRPKIYYYDMSTLTKRILLVIFPFRRPQNIDLSSIADYQLQGDYNKFEDIKLPLTMTTAYGLFFPAILSIKNSMVFNLYLKNSKVIVINLSMDYVYYPDEFRQKIDSLQSYLPRR